MKNNTAPDRESGAFLKTNLKDILASANRFHADLLAEISQRMMADGKGRQTEGLIILLGKRDEMENLLTPLCIFADYDLEAEKSQEIGEIRERIQLLMMESRYVGNHEHDVALQLEALNHREASNDQYAEAI